MSFALPLSPLIGKVDKNVHSPYFANHFSYIRSAISGIAETEEKV